MFIHLIAAFWRQEHLKVRFVLGWGGLRRVGLGGGEKGGGCCYRDTGR